MFDVIVIGGGHAGCEASASSARVGAKTLLITKSLHNIGEMSCNPAFGGIAKGIVIKEIDALDGVMPMAIDKSSIHSRVLNKSKGAAVWGPRAQADRELYKKAMQEILQNYKNLSIKITSIHDLIIENNQVNGVITESNEKIHAKSVILATGTFLNGIIHVGANRIAAGRYGENPTIKLADTLKKYFKLNRLKTGTPPRLDKNSIDWNILEKQQGDLNPRPFSAFTKKIINPQVPCYITHTNNITHQIIKENIHLSAINNGLEIRGPRYCPCIEDKVIKFKDKEKHQIFLEPEGLNSDLIYPNGISNSLPKEIQERFIRSIKGLENVKMIRHGYTIEYEYIDTVELLPTLESKKINGLYFAGQINGTTGYEEAAGQGLVAGVNAAYNAQSSVMEFILSRTNSYIGVMIDDLVTSGVAGEPYRLFTSRSEYRLSVRADNSDIRLTNQGFESGIVSKERRNIYEKRTSNIALYKDKLSNLSMSPTKLLDYGIRVSQDGVNRNAMELLSYPEIRFRDIARIWLDIQNAPSEIQEIIETDAKYDPYLKKQEADIKLLKQEENIRIPRNFDFERIKTLSNEAKEKLKAIMPYTVAAAKRISGITPAAIMSIMIHLKYKE